MVEDLYAEALIMVTTAIEMLKEKGLSKEEVIQDLTEAVKNVW